MSKLHQATSFLNYWLHAMDQHSLHSPFIYELYTDVIKPNRSNVYNEVIEQLREDFKKDERKIDITDYGAGSKVDNSKRRLIADIAQKGISKGKYSSLFSRLVDHFEYKHIMELGTSLGINTMYLSQNPSTRVTTFEGSGELCTLANKSFQDAKRSNITIVEGNIDITLPEFLDRSKKIDLAFFDANHTYLSTINYFNQCKRKAHDLSCFIFDDIHLSKEMDQAWKEIYQHYEVTVSIDLYQVGIVFLNPELTKQHYVLSF